MPPHCVSLRNPQFVLSGLAFTINICSWSTFLLAEVASMRGEEPQRWVSSVGTGWHHNHPRQLFPCWWFSLLRQYWSGYRDLPWCESERHRTLSWNWSQGHSSHPALWHGTIASWDSPSPGIQNARIYYLYTPLPSTAQTTTCKEVFCILQSEPAKPHSMTCPSCHLPQARRVWLHHPTILTMSCGGFIYKHMLMKEDEP